MPGGWCVCLATAAIRCDAGRAMKKPRPVRRRCMVCRKWFLPAASARKTQLVCCEECRRKRDRVLARARRLEALDRYRAEECERQRKCRRARRERLGVVPARVRVTECHALPSSSDSGSFWRGEHGQLGQAAVWSRGVTRPPDFVSPRKTKDIWPEAVTKRHVPASI